MGCSEKIATVGAEDMTRESLRAGTVSTTAISEALLDARGDLFVAASILGVTGRELDGYIRAS